MATKVQGSISSIGIMAGVLVITPIVGPAVTVKVSDNQRDKMLPKLKVGDKIEVWVNPDNTVKGGITMLEQNRDQTKPIDTFPTKKEQGIMASAVVDLHRENAILWQSCMKAAIEVEKFFVGNVEDRQEVCKNVLVSTNWLYEGSQRKMRGEPPIPEAAKD